MMAPDKKHALILVAVVALIAGGLLAWRFNLVPEIGKFFAAELPPPYPITALNGLLPDTGPAGTVVTLAMTAPLPPESEGEFSVMFGGTVVPIVRVAANGSFTFSVPSVKPGNYPVALRREGGCATATRTPAPTCVPRELCSYSGEAPCAAETDLAPGVVWCPAPAPLEPFGVDILANGSNGPITVAAGSTVSIQWSSRGAARCSSGGAGAAAWSAQEVATFGSVTFPAIVGKNNHNEFLIGCVDAAASPNDVREVHDTVVVDVLPPTQTPVCYGTTLSNPLPFTVTEGPVVTCMPRPACLDSVPRCLPPEPAEGWCPPVSTCPIPECANPPDGCSYQGGDRCSCGPLVCPSATPTPTSSGPKQCGSWEGDLLPQGGEPFSESVLRVSKCMDEAILFSECSAADVSHSQEDAQALRFEVRPGDNRCVMTLKYEDGSGSVCRWTPEQLASMRDFLAEQPDQSTAVVFPELFMINGISADPDLHCNSDECPDCVTLTPMPTPTEVGVRPGDADGDGDVDIFDYNAVVSNFGKDGAKAGDTDSDGDVDIFDYNAVVSNFGR